MTPATKLFARFVLPILVFTPLNACALSGGPLKGKVLEEGTEKPIAGAIVVARWQGQLASFAHGRTVCVHVESTVTDGEGIYRLPAWRKPSDIGWVKDLHPIIIAHKADYQWGRLSKVEDVQYLKHFTGTRQERLDYLLHVLEATRCGAGDESERNLHPLYKALYEEGRNIAVAGQEKEVVDTLRYWSTFVLFDPSKPSVRDEKGRLINVEPGERTR